MKKPNDFETVTAYGEFKPLSLGGHICDIMGVEETVSQSDKPMLKISLDIAREDGEEAGYYAEQYRNDTRAEKKWGCVVYQLIYDKDGSTSRGFKTFITAVEKSNPNFTPQWGDGFAACFKKKKVGGVFGREQYRGNDGKLHFSTKCVQFRSVEAVQEGIDPPADKLLKEENTGGFGGYAFNMTPPPVSAPNTPPADFEPLTDDELPF